MDFLPGFDDGAMLSDQEGADGADGDGGFTLSDEEDETTLHDDREMAAQFLGTDGGQKESALELLRKTGDDNGGVKRKGNKLQMGPLTTLKGAK